MMHIAWCCLGEVPYCFLMSSHKFQGHTAKKSSILTQIETFIYLQIFIQLCPHTDRHLWIAWGQGVLACCSPMLELLAHITAMLEQTLSWHLWCPEIPWYHILFLTSQSCLQHGLLTKYVKLRVAHAPGTRRENSPCIPGACATNNFTYLARGPWIHNMDAYASYALYKVFTGLPNNNIQFIRHNLSCHASLYLSFEIARNCLLFCMILANVWKINNGVDFVFGSPDVMRPDRLCPITCHNVEFAFWYIQLSSWHKSF